ncbi:Eukaryotic translation initiation factor 2D, partial [Kappamyces sp. JEL0680]
MARIDQNLSIFLVSGQPLFFVSYELGIVPSLYLLWKHPDLLPMILTNSHVVERLSNGADLMAPGVVCTRDNTVVCSASAGFEKGDIVAIAPIGPTPQPVCLGVALMSSREIAEAEHGRAIKTLHVVGDKLWEMGDKSTPPLEPLDAHSIPASSDTPAEVASPTESAPSLAEGAASPAVSPQDMDEIMERCLLGCLNDTIADSMLPMTASVVYSAHMLHCKRGNVVDVKLSTFKKMSKFLKCMDKKGYITTKEKAGEVVLVRVMRTHPQYLACSASQPKS